MKLDVDNASVKTVGQEVLEKLKGQQQQRQQQDSDSEG